MNSQFSCLSAIYENKQGMYMTKTYVENMGTGTRNMEASQQYQWLAG